MFVKLNKELRNLVYYSINSFLLIHSLTKLSDILVNKKGPKGSKWLRQYYLQWDKDAHFYRTSSTVAVSFSMAACSEDIACKVRSSMSDSSSTDEGSKRMPSCISNSSCNITSSTFNFSLNCIKILVRFITNSNYNTRGFYNNILTFFKTLALDSSPDGEEVLKLVSHFFSTVVYTRQRLCMFRPANNIQHNIPQQNKDRH